MNKFQKIPVVIVSIAALIILALQLDILIAGRVSQTEELTMAARFFSFIGNGAFLAGISLAVYLLGIALKRMVLQITGRTALFSVFASGICVHILKAAFERPRPGYASGAVLKLLENPSLVDLSGRFNSFPSGHTTTAFAVAYVFAKRYPRFGIAFYLIAALVAASRVYLGSHYPTDVLAGAFLGVTVGYLLTNHIRVFEKWQIAGIALLIIFISFFKTGGFLVFDVDEAVFSEASREMMETGDIITPTYDYEPRYDKPILIYWFMSSAFKVLGVSEFSARLTSSGFGALLVLMTFFFIRHLKGMLPAFFVSIALLLNIEYFVYTHSSVTDMTLGFFLAASLYSFYLGYSQDKKWFSVFWIASALAVLTKGAIGLLFPIVISGAFLVLRKDLQRLKDVLNLKYIGIFFLISVPWFAAEFYVNGMEFFNAFIIKHHIQRYSGVISSHSGPFYYYLGVLLIGFFPWAMFLPGAVVKGFKERENPASSLYLLGAIWFSFVLVFFSIAQTKLPNYIFPLFPAAAILSGLLISDIVEKKKGIRDWWQYLLGLFSLALGIGIIYIPSMGLKMPIAFPVEFFYTLGGIFIAIAVLSFISLKKALPAFTAMAGLMIILLVFLRVQALPPVNVFLQKTLYNYASYAKSNLKKTDVFATYEVNKPSITFYAQRKVERLEKSNACNIKEYVKKGRMLIVTTPSKADELKEYDYLKVIDSKGEYMLLGTEGFPPLK